MRPFEKQRVSRLGSFWYEESTISADSIPMSRTINSVSPELRMRELMQINILHTEVIGYNRELTISSENIIRLGPSAMPQKSVSVHTGSLLNLPISDTYEIEWDSIVNELSKDTIVALRSAGLIPGEGAVGFQQAGVKFWEDMWVLPIDADIRPIRIIDSNGHAYLSGSVFDTKRGFLVFRQDPATLFPDRVAQLQAYVQYPYHPFEYPLGCVNLFPQDNVYQYLRNSQTIESFKRALANVAGLAVIPKDSELIGVYGDIYVFTDYTLHIPYDHTPLSPGLYSEGTVIGDLQIHGGSGSWWPLLNWDSGLVLGSSLGMSGLTLPYEQRAARVTSQGSGGLHVRISLDGDSAVQDLFWDVMHNAEERTGIYLNDVLGMSEVGEEISVNPLEVFMSIYGRQLLRVDVGSLESDVIRNLKDFIVNNKPVGSLVILHEGSSSEMVYTGLWDDTALWEDDNFWYDSAEF